MPRGLRLFLLTESPADLQEMLKELDENIWIMLNSLGDYENNILLKKFDNYTYLGHLTAMNYNIDIETKKRVSLG